MNRTALIALAGIAGVGVLLAIMFLGTRGSHVELQGSILKVRAIQVGEDAVLVVADFRITNPSKIPFLVEDVKMTLEPASGEPVKGAVASKSQMDVVFQGEKLIGPKYNDILGIQDRVPAGATLDRTAAARFEVSQGALDARKTIRIRIEEIDGASAEIVEKR